VRERDKDVSRSVRERLDALRDARAEGEAAGARVEQLAGEAAALASTEDTSHLAERVALLRRHREEALEKLAATTPVLERFGLPTCRRPPPRHGSTRRSPPSTHACRHGRRRGRCSSRSVYACPPSVWPSRGRRPTPR
jgi:ferric-dicitrate binding protein FerR (iron transport regulator)